MRVDSSAKTILYDFHQLSSYNDSNLSDIIVFNPTYSERSFVDEIEDILNNEPKCLIVDLQFDDSDIAYLLSLNKSNLYLVDNTGKYLNDENVGHTRIRYGREVELRNDSDIFHLLSRVADKEYNLEYPESVLVNINYPFEESFTVIDSTYLGRMPLNDKLVIYGYPYFEDKHEVVTGTISGIFIVANLMDNLIRSDYIIENALNELLILLLLLIINTNTNVLKTLASIFVVVIISVFEIYVFGILIDFSIISLFLVLNLILVRLYKYSS